jgi:hypothetical protein
MWLVKVLFAFGSVGGWGGDGAAREEGAHMHHADPATLAVAGAQARRQGGCFGETLPLLSASTPDTPLAAVRCCHRAGACRAALRARCGCWWAVRLFYGWVLTRAIAFACVMQCLRAGGRDSCSVRCAS